MKLNDEPISEDSKILCVHIIIWICTFCFCVYSAGVPLVAVCMCSWAETCAAGDRLKPVLRNRGRTGGRYGDWLNWILHMSGIDAV